MQRYFIDFDNQGMLKARYIDAIHGAMVPDTAMLVDEALFFKTIEQPDKIWKLGDHGQVFGEVAVVKLEQRQFFKVNEIKQRFQNAVKSGFIISLGFKMDSDIDDLQKLKTSYDLAVMMGETTMTIVDYDNKPHADVPLSEVEKILKEVYKNYRNLYLKKQDLRQQVEQATTPESLEQLVWQV